MEFATVIKPALTTVRFPITDIGEEAARHIIERLDGKAVPCCIELPLELAVRQRASTLQQGQGHFQSSCTFMAAAG